MRPRLLSASSTAALLLGLAAAGASLATPALAQEPFWTVVKPSNSGLPGEEMRLSRWAPDGRLWSAARWPFWGEAGVAIFDLELETWEVYSNWETPLPSQFVNDLEFDAQGVAWIATSSGLARFDGADWTIWDSSNSPLQHDVVRNLSLAPNGHIWVNSSSSGAGGDAIFDFDGVSSWTRYQVPDDLPWDAPWTDLSNVFVASDGHVWVANDTLPGVAEFDGLTWTKRGESHGKLDDMAEDGFGNVWLMGHPIGGPAAYFRWNGASFTTYPIAEPQTLNAGPDGSIYVGSWLGEIQRTLDGGQSVQTFLTGLNQVFDIAPAADGDVWVTTIGALGHFRGDGTWVRDFNTWNTGMPDYFLERFTTDRDGYFWTASGEAGLSRFDGSRWRNWGNHNVGSEPYPFAGNEPMGTAFLDSRGVHWFGGNGIARWDSATGEFTGFWNWENNPGMGVGLWIHFAEDAAGNVFAVENYGATYRFDEPSQLWVREDVFPYAVSGIPGMFSDSAGNVWLGAWFDIHKWDGAAWSKVELPYTDFFFDLGGISSLAIGPDDVIWAGTVEGLVRWDGVDFQVFGVADSPLPYPHVTSVDVRDDGLVGFSCYDFGQLAGGAVVLDGDPADPASWDVHLQSETPIPHWQVEAAHFDPNGDLWIGATSEGAAVLHLGATPGPALKAPEPALACLADEWLVTDGQPGDTAYLLASLPRGELAVPGCPGLELGIAGRRLLGSAVVDAEGVARIPASIPCGAAGRQVLFQALDRTSCVASPVLPVVFE